MKIAEAIEDGDAARARHLAARHLEESQRYVLADGELQLITVEGLTRRSW